MNEQVAGFFMTPGKPVPQSDFTNSEEMYLQVQIYVIRKI